MSIKKPTRAEGIERIRTLYAVLAGIPGKHMRLSTWINVEHPDAGMPTARKLVHNCGSTACALGWATLYPEFQEQGLYTANGVGWTPAFDGALCFAAAQGFFCLSSAEACVLFGTRYADGSGSPMKVACYEGLPDMYSKESLALSDKRIALHRLRRWLELTDAITPERSAELAEIEKGY